MTQLPTPKLPQLYKMTQLNLDHFLLLLLKTLRQQSTVHSCFATVQRHMNTSLSFTRVNLNTWVGGLCEHPHQSAAFYHGQFLSERESNPSCVVGFQSPNFAWRQV